MKHLLFFVASFFLTFQFSFAQAPTDSQGETGEFKVIKDIDDRIEEVISNQGKVYDKKELESRLAYFYKGSWSNLKSRAEKERKPFFVEVETDWCRVCKQMDNEVFASDQIRKFSQNNYLAYKLDGEKNASIAQDYNVSIYPTILVFDPDGNLVERVEGLITHQGMMKLLEANKPVVKGTRYSTFR